MAAIVLIMAVGCSDAGRAESDSVSDADKTQSVRNRAEEVKSTEPVTEQALETGSDIFKETDEESDREYQTGIEKGYRLPLDEAAKKRLRRTAGRLWRRSAPSTGMRTRETPSIPYCPGTIFPGCIPPCRNREPGYCSRMLLQDGEL